MTVSVVGFALWRRLDMQGLLYERYLDLLGITINVVASIMEYEVLAVNFLLKYIRYVSDIEIYIINILREASHCADENKCWMTVENIFEQVEEKFGTSNWNMGHGIVILEGLDYEEKITSGEASTNIPEIKLPAYRLAGENERGSTNEKRTKNVKAQVC